MSQYAPSHSTFAVQTILQIESTLRPYAVREAASLRAALETLGDASTHWLLVDQALLEIHRDTLQDVFGTARIYAVEAGEEAKSFERLQPVLSWLLETGFRRESTLIAVGGGVVQDIAGFVASILFRGARWSLLPSTLLAQCDSCIGSKSSINFLHFKNQLGTFYPPREVVIVFDLLDSLPHEALLSGLGEIIKLHLVDGPRAWASLRDSLEASPLSTEGVGLSTNQRAMLRRLIVDSLNIKKRFIEADEFDTGMRNLLNYGHTFGHAYEAATHYAIPHGIAVTLGLATATWFSARLGWVQERDAQELILWLRPYFEPYEYELRSVSPQAIFEAMCRDKKNVGQGITCILTRGPGAMEKVTLPRERVQPLLGQWLQALSNS